MGLSVTLLGAVWYADASYAFGDLYGRSSDQSRELINTADDIAFMSRWLQMNADKKELTDTDLFWLSYIAMMSDRLSADLRDRYRREQERKAWNFLDEDRCWRVK